jgi:hypothetical protein
VKKAIMTDIHDLVGEGAVGASFFTMRRLFEILQRCSIILEVCFDIISFFATAVY